MKIAFYFFIIQTGSTLVQTLRQTKCVSLVIYQAGMVATLGTTERPRSGSPVGLQSDQPVAVAKEDPQATITCALFWVYQKEAQIAYNADRKKRGEGECLITPNDNF